MSGCVSSVYSGAHIYTHATTTVFRVGAVSRTRMSGFRTGVCCTVVKILFFWPVVGAL